MVIRCAIEFAPEGTGYRSKTRFAKFHNLPELMALFKEVADIQTADTLHLPTPEVENHNIVVKPSQIQKDMVQELGERAERIRGGSVDVKIDNMLKITNEGRKLALDQSLINSLLEGAETSKVRSGDVRVLIGSTQKMGAGTNVQDRLIALHHLDCPWRPSEVGCILRTFKMVA